MKYIVLTAGIFLVFMVAGTAGVEAASFSLQPSAGAISIGGTHALDVVVNSPPADATTVAISLTAPGSLIQITGLSPAANTLKFDCPGYAGGFDSDEVCAAIAKLGANNFLTNGEVIATIYLTGVGDGLASLDFTTIGSQQSGFQGSSSGFTPATGNGGVYTVGAGGGSVLSGTPGTLPDTALIDDAADPILLAGALALVAISINRSGQVLNLFGIRVRKRDLIPNLVGTFTGTGRSIWDQEQIETDRRKWIESQTSDYQRRVIDGVN